jgi:iron complex transport system substrate-binding protein
MKIFRAVLAAALCLTVFSGCGPNAENTKPASDDKAFLTITDDTGRTVVLPEKPERVVSLATSYLNMIDAVGGKIVGRASSKIGEMPEAMKNVPEVGFVYNINMESLIGLKPDLVIANKNQHEKFLPLLESNKIPVIAINPKTYDEVKDKLILMGKIYGVPEKGEAAAAKLDQQVKAVTEKLPKDGKRIVIMHATPSNVTVELENSIARQKERNTAI